MKRLLMALATVMLMLMSSCMDQEPGEISVRAKLDGQQKNCMVNVFNSNHKQVQQVATDFAGLVYVKALAPGTYYLEFTDTQGNPYPAKKEVEVEAGGTAMCDVELNEQPADTSGGA